MNDLKTGGKENKEGRYYPAFFSVVIHPFIHRFFSTSVNRTFSMRWRGAYVPEAGLEPARP